MRWVSGIHQETQVRQTIAAHSSFRQGAYLGMPHVTLQTPLNGLLPGDAANSQYHAGIQGYALKPA
jgi:hypothetical protein